MVGEGKQEGKKEEKKVRVMRDMMIGEAVQMHEAVAKIMFEYGLHCIGCAVSPYETIEQGCRGHGMDDKKIDEMIEKINKAIGGPEAEKDSEKKS